VTTTQSCPEDFTSSSAAASNNNNVISGSYSPSLDRPTSDERGAQFDQREDTEARRVPVCASCQRPVLDRYYLTALGVAWHVACLTCQQCGRPLDSQLTCFVRDGAVYCRDDYYR